MERKDTLSPLPIGKFTNAYMESFKKSSPSSDLLTPNNSTGQQNEDDKIIENGDIAGNNVVCVVVKTISLELLDSYDGASSRYNCGSMSLRDAPNVPDSEAEDIFYNNDILGVNQVELNIDNTLNTPVSDFDKETSPDTLFQLPVHLLKILLLFLLTSVLIMKLMRHLQTLMLSNPPKVEKRNKGRIVLEGGHHLPKRPAKVLTTALMMSHVKKKSGICLEESQHLPKTPTTVLITALTMPHIEKKGGVALEGSQHLPK